MRGDYYQIKGAIMNPQPVQKPRPPLMIGANGSHMLKIAAQYADTWNTFGGVDVKTPAEMLALTRQRTLQLDGYCAEMGRDPTTLRRSILIYTQEEYMQMYSTPGAFADIIKRYWEIGITEFVFFYPFVPVMLPLFEHIATEAIPRLREELNVAWPEDDGSFPGSCSPSSTCPKPNPRSLLTMLRPIFFLPSSLHKPGEHGRIGKFP